MRNDTLPLFKLCSIPDCGRALQLPYGRGMCGKHYQRWRKLGDPLAPPQRPKVQGVVPCAVEGCTALSKAADMCAMHYTRSRRAGDPAVKWSTAIERVCVVCGETYMGSGRQTKACSPACKTEYTLAVGRAHRAEWRRTHPRPEVPSTSAVCPYCKQELKANKRRSLYCSVACSTGDKYAASYQIRLDKMKTVEFEQIRKIDIFLRDNWTCGICGDAIDPKLAWPHRQSASMDHIYPISLGGGHVHANVQAAHLVCNIKKSNKVS